MKIAIDCSPLAKTRTGIGTYTFNLIKSLSKIDSENEYYLFAHRNFDFGAELASNFIQIKPKREFTRSTPWLFRSLPKELRRNKIDIFHGTNFLIPPNSGCKTISTVHDLSSLTMPSRHSFLHKISHSLFLKSSLKRADRLIAVSSFTARELGRLFPRYTQKTSVVLEAASPEYRHIEDRGIIEDLKVRYALPKRFILFIGTLEPRKNVPGLLKAFNKIRSQIEYKLVIVGGKGWKFAEVFDLVEKLDLSDLVVFPGYIPAKDLPSLYNAADVFCYPSFFEGFGLPPLEAMACGTPVVTSNVSSLPEVVGEASVLVDPTNIDEIAEGLLRVIKDDEFRKSMIEKGRSRASLFTWESCALKTLAIYQELI